MKKLLVILPLLFVFATFINAQPRDERPRPNFENLKQELNLSGEQAEKFELLFNQKLEEMKAVKEFFKEERSAARDKMIEINDKYHKQFSEILDEEQLEKFEEITKERREERMDRPRRKFKN